MEKILTYIILLKLLGKVTFKKKKKHLLTFSFLIFYERNNDSRNLPR
jgi:hypothetical protein